MGKFGFSRGAKSKSDLSQCCEGKLGILFMPLEGNEPHLKLRQETQASSPIVTGSQGAYRVSAGESGLVSC